MRTDLSPEALASPDLALSNDIIRTCVHCGICLSHCPTYQVRHDENDSPRGRIVLMRNMLEKGGTPDEMTVKHLDRCLSCLACEAICPSGVKYSKLIGQSREHIEAHYPRPAVQRGMRHLLAKLVPSPGLFRMALIAGRAARPMRSLFPGTLRAMLDALPGHAARRPSAVDRPQVFPAQGPRRARVSMLSGCVQKVLEPGINEATIRLLQRHGVEVVVARGAGCCGALSDHMGMAEQAQPMMKANIEAWLREAGAGDSIDAIIINASGCGTAVKAYGHALRHDPAWAERAARVSALAKDVTEFMTDIGLNADLVRPERTASMRVVYHAPCSMQHGQHIVHQPLDLLRKAGFEVAEPPDSFMCCGSAGIYNLLQPEIAGELKRRKAWSIRSVDAAVAATGNIGCMTQLADAVGIPFVHTVELLDWATGGPEPQALRGSKPPGSAQLEKAVSESASGPVAGSNPTI
ncbi:glycolate oxidase subunit GlcF [Paraburkholderia pallida]|uniref:glycolate oxidase subunit GlcF n=1 Tax=Paraburkholderia pallida TaxID=2547399 RepID=UPI0018D64DA1|nr:glycolate oxidase subunit GlcF [Paraburkholderia pallida]